MKMEVLSVQNQFQRQFDILTSTKVKDWTSPLTPPPHSTHHYKISEDTISSDLSSAISPSSTTSSSNNSNINKNSNYQLPFATTLQYYQQYKPKQDDASLNCLCQRLQNELRAAKTCHLACTEVLLPHDLLHRVTTEIIKVSEKEPCGVKGCSIFIEFEDDVGNTRRIASLKVDPNTVSTFELYLTLKHDKSGWTSILPQFLKNLTRSNTIMISHEFSLTKNKLYHTYLE